MTRSWRSEAPTNFVTLAVGRCLTAQMNASRWIELGLLTNVLELIEGHPRLLRAMRFEDDDYERCVFEVTPAILGANASLAPTGPTSVTSRPLHERFANLVTVSEFLSLESWLESNDQKMLERLFTADDIDATLPDGTVLSAAEAAAARLDVGEMRRQVERIRRDHAADPEAAVGQAKELIETTCKTILGMTGDAAGAPDDLPKLITRTLRHLGLDPSQVSDSHGDVPAAHAAKRMLGGMASVLNGAVELRNARGTGHGRSRSPAVDPALARLAVGLVLPATIFLIGAFEALTGHRTLPDLVDRPAPSKPLEVEAEVVHETFGYGRVEEIEGEGRKTVATINFGEALGRRRLMVKYAPLKVLRR